jgi:hypothetical protein
MAFSVSVASRHNMIWRAANKAEAAMAKLLGAFLVVLAGLGIPAAHAGFRSPESLVRNVYAYYGDRSSDLSSGLPHDPATAAKFFDRSLRTAWSLSKTEPYDFFVQSPTWKLGAVTISIVRKQFDKTYVSAGFDNHGRAVTLNFILVNGPDGWVISDVESPHDSLRMFLAQYKN